MNKKLIAVAVASTLAAPVVFADGHEGITPYGRINNAIDFSDSSGDSTTDITGISSRFGFKGNADVGNGMSAFGRYEFSTTTDKEQNNVNDLRLGYVGLSGGFGSVSIGNQWSAYFNTFGTIVSPTYTLGYYLYSSVAGGPFRSSNTIKYANSFGPVSLEADLRLNESGEGNDVAEKLNGDGYGIGLSVSPTDNLTIALAFDQEENNNVVDADSGAITSIEDTDRFGIGGTMAFGTFEVNLGYQQLDQGNTSIEHIQLYLKANVGEKTSLLAGYGQVENDTTAVEPNSVFLGVYHNLGGGLKLWLETTTVDFDSDADGDNASGDDDTSRTLLGMRIDF